MAVNGLDLNLAVILKYKSHGWLAPVWGPSNLDLSCVSGFSCTISSVMVYFYFFFTIPPFSLVLCVTGSVQVECVLIILSCLVPHPMSRFPFVSVSRKRKRRERKSRMWWKHWENGEWKRGAGSQPTLRRKIRTFSC